MRNDQIIDPTVKMPTAPKAVISRRTFYFEVILAGVFLVVTILTLLAKQRPYFSFDLVITRFIQNINFLGFNELMQFITFLGNNYLSAPLVLMTALFLFVKKWKLQSALLIISTVGSALIAGLLKLVVARPRPDDSLIRQVEQFTRHDSFPSGHVLFYMGFFGFLLFLTYSSLPKGLMRTVILVLLSILILLAGPSRIYLGSHWFSDVLGAYMLGFLWLFVMTLLFNRFHQKKNDS